MSDEQLYTGLTSQSAAKAKEAKSERKEEEAKKRNVLLPAGELLRAEFAKEIDKVSRINYVDLSKLTDDFSMKAELVAQQRVVIILTAIGNRLTNLLRDNK